jgi:hypothetical protein
VPPKGLAGGVSEHPDRTSTKARRRVPYVGAARKAPAAGTRAGSEIQVM